MNSKRKILTIAAGIIVAIGVLVSMGISLSMGPGLFKEIDQEKRIMIGDIADIQVTMSSASVNIIRTQSGNEIMFHYYGKALQKMDLVSEIRNQAVVVFARRKYGFLGTGENMVLDIYVPEEYSKKLSIKTSSGALKMDSLSFASFTLDTSSGGLEANSLNAGKVNINTTSGKINIATIKADELVLKGSSSAITIDECFASQTQMKISSGKIWLKNISGNLDIKGTSGSIQVACKKFDDQNVHINTTSGNIVLELPGSAEFLIESKMTSGKFQSDFPLNLAKSADKRNITGQIGTANHKIALQTTSGNITVAKMDR